ncbi:MAG: succinate dehydrogenase/fumarate reductase iron-sulfur subunit [Gammaproteobacteria bacterium]|nr:succinate dehydrogenase/fumarate reductase iron-sulfur subunit [Gammaproteobacteria bacterium]
MLTVKIRRGDSSKAVYQTYQVPALESQTVLDVVSWIQRNLQPDLAYRFACRVGMCGSCAMTVNGKPRWTCRSHVSHVIEGDSLTIEPLRNLPVIKDLTCDLNEFFDKWIQAKGQFTPSKTRQDPIQAIKPADRKRKQANAAIECINCAVCYAACDVVEQDKQYLGPAALNRAWTLLNDVRDGGNAERLKAVSREGGCQSCHSQQGCTHHCPNMLNPTQSIAGLKRAAAFAVLKGDI